MDVLVATAVSLVLMTAGDREPQFPLKTDRVIYTDAMIRQARDNVSQYAAAKKLADKAVRAGDPWLEWGDAELRDLVPTAAVPRAFNVGTAGCPLCGEEVYEKGGTYPWILDLKRPFTVECPVDGHVFPDNDFKAYYESGMTDKASLEGEYADDGWGWVGPDGERYWFVGYANHWTLHSHVVPAMGRLATAYLLTSDERYAHKAAVLLDRIAEVYPAMDYHSQSRYGQLQEEHGTRYPGKLVNLIWATGNLNIMARAYDAVWETIDGDAELQALTGKSGEAIRANIEANLLEEGIDGVFAEEIRGNFGMHQRALVYATLARQHGKTDEWLDGIFTRTGCSTLQTGLNYALYNLVYRDGLPYETAPGYNRLWVSTITSVAETLKGTKRDVYGLPKTRRLYDGVLDMVNVGKHTPSVGDSGSVSGGSMANAALYLPAYRAYGDPRYLARLNDLDATGEQCFQSLDSLFSPPIPAGTERSKPLASRLLDGYGMGILCNGADSISASVYYGYKGGHGHFDRLHVDVFAHGLPMMPDTGYPDFMNAYVPGIYTWSKNTIAHNTVTVDAGRQVANEAGAVHSFVNGAFARVLDVDAAQTYPQCSQYRRHLVMVDIEDGGAYFVDFFAVDGGGQHDYSLHGPPGKHEIVGGEWKVQEKGTLAGEDVALTQLYDDAERGEEGFSGTYYGYAGSGFQHLFNVRRLATPFDDGAGDAPFVAQYAHQSDEDARIRLRVLPQTDTELIVADAQVSPVKHKELLQYVIARRIGEDLRSRFVGIFEPYTDTPRIESARRIDLPGGAVAVVVARPGGRREVVVCNPDGGLLELANATIKTDAVTAVVTLDSAGAAVRAFAISGTRLEVGGRTFEIPPASEGTVVAVDAAACRATIALETPEQAADFSALVGRVVHFVNPARRTAHRAMAVEVEGTQAVLTVADDLLVGRARITAVEDAALTTDTAFMFAPVYRGRYAADAGLTRLTPVSTVEAGRIGLVNALPEDHGFRVGADAWIVDVGPGDRLTAPGVLEWR